MAWWMIVWLCTCGLVGLLWAVRHGAIARAIRDNHLLRHDSYPPASASSPKLSVLVAAKEEEETIETCVRTMLDQDYPNYEVIAVNDRSEDRTGKILDQLAEEYDGRLTVVHVETLPPGWLGKSHAMQLGVEQSCGDWLCFIDADCRQTCRSTLSVTVQAAEEKGIDFLSVLPVLETRSFWERVIQPVCAAIMVIWFNPAKVNDPRTKTAYANGAFMLMTRACYQAIGGHAAVKGYLNEDMHLARLAKELGHRLFVVENEGLYVTRMYASFVAAWNGWSRIFCGCFGSMRRLGLTLTLLLVASVFPYASLAVSLTMVLTTSDSNRDNWYVALAVTCLVVAVLKSVIIRFMRLVRAAPWAWITYPIGAILGAGMVVSAMRKLQGKTTWRGTEYTSRHMRG